MSATYWLISLPLFLCTSSGNTESKEQLLPSKEGPYVILKLDDLWVDDGFIHPGWLEVVAFLNEEDIIGTIGIVGKDLKEGNPKYFQWIKDRVAEGHEVWHHGYCHCKPIVDSVQAREFRGTDYDYQLQHLKETQQLAFEQLGITLRSFGAPYNSTDEHTAQALAEIREIEVWMYKETAAPTDKYVLPRISAVNIEYPVHVPDFERFKAGYVKHQDEPVLVIQGHPRSWVEDSTRMEAFKEIIRFLQSKRARFTTPYAYYQMQQATRKP